MSRNTVRVDQIVKKIANSRSVEMKMSKIVYKNFERERRKVINEFESHPVTKELEMGPDANNISGTTHGIGNLYSFIGFPQGANPVEPVRKLMMGIKISRRPQKTVISKNKIEKVYKVYSPGMSDFQAETPMPWETGLSWVRGVERGISGFGHFMATNSPGAEGFNFSGSRSGGGVEVKRTLSTMGFKPVKYLSLILSNFRRRLAKQ
jgi:hypothetical protein